MPSLSSPRLSPPATPRPRPAREAGAVASVGVSCVSRWAHLAQKGIRSVNESRRQATPRPAGSTSACARARASARAAGGGRVGGGEKVASTGVPGPPLGGIGPRGLNPGRRPSTRWRRRGRRVGGVPAGGGRGDRDRKKRKSMDSRQCITSRTFCFLCPQRGACLPESNGSRFFLLAGPYDGPLMLRSLPLSPRHTQTRGYTHHMLDRLAQSPLSLVQHATCDVYQS